MCHVSMDTRVLASCCAARGRQGPAAPFAAGNTSRLVFGGIVLLMFLFCGGEGLFAGAAGEECRAPGDPAGPLPADNEVGSRTWTRLQWTTQRNLRRKVVYGNDDRQDVYQVNNQALLRMSEATCALVAPRNIERQPDGRYTLSGRDLRTARDLCASEPFGSQPTSAFCTGFLVSHDVVATAGHCVPATGCDATAFVFGYKMLNSSTPKMVLEDEDVYFCSEVVGHRMSGGVDYALVRLDRSVSGREPVEVRRSGKVPDRAALVMIGHPSGLPQKIAGGARVRDNSPGSHFVANTDSYGGNSGSPVFNEATHEVEGILVRGVTDYVQDGGCYVSNQCDDDGCGGEDATRATHFADLVPPPGGPVVFEVYFGQCGNMRLLGETDDEHWILSDLDINTGYCWRVVASNDCGSVTGPTWSFTTGEETGPDPDLPNNTIENAWPIEASGGTLQDVSDSTSPSLWWTWEAPGNGLVVFDTIGSGFDTMLAAYDSSERMLAENDDTHHLQSEVRFEARAGDRYYVSVSGYGGATGDITLSWSLDGAVVVPGPAPGPGPDPVLPPGPGGTPTNDDIDDSVAIGSQTGTAGGDSSQAGDDAWEEDLLGSASVWWEWIPPVGGVLSVDTFGSGYDTTLSVLLGSSPGDMEVLVSNDDTSGLQSRIEFTAIAAESYMIRVAGYHGATGSIVLNWNVVEPDGPVVGPVRFLRSDVNQDGQADMSDAVAILGDLFLGDVPVGNCRESMDVDDNGFVEITDGIYLLTFLFSGGRAPAAPFDDCGVDRGGGSLGCESYAPCAQ